MQVEPGEAVGDRRRPVCTGRHEGNFDNGGILDVLYAELLIEFFERYTPCFIHRRKNFNGIARVTQGIIAFGSGIGRIAPANKGAQQFTSPRNYVVARLKFRIIEEVQRFHGPDDQWMRRQKVYFGLERRRGFSWAGGVRLSGGRRGLIALHD